MSPIVVYPNPDAYTQSPHPDKGDPILNLSLGTLCPVLPYPDMTQESQHVSIPPWTSGGRVDGENGFVTGDSVC